MPTIRHAIEFFRIPFRPLAAPPARRRRLRAAGIGFPASVGSNANDAGRALNRRVELVAP
jgi:flagellar motor protein MotB